MPRQELVSAPPDEELATLVRRALADDEAFLELYDRFADELFSFLVKLTGDEALAEDALQESFLRVWRSLESYDPERSFRGWIFQVARNAAIDRIGAKCRAAPSGRTNAQV